jgi:hypothetical protein
MSLNVPASQSFLKNLRCAYTGKPVTVRVVSSADRVPLYFSPDAWDPLDFVGTPEELFAMAGTRDGIRGAVKDGAELVCPYTAVKMRVEKTSMGYHLVGGFSPGGPVADPVEFARRMLMRHGVVPSTAPHAVRVLAARIERVDQETPAPAVTEAEAEQLVEQIVPWGRK